MTKSVTSNQNKILRELYSPSADRNEESFYFIIPTNLLGRGRMVSCLYLHMI